VFRITPQPTARHRIARCLLASVCMAILVPEFLALPFLFVNGVVPFTTLGANPFAEETDSEKEKEEQNDNSKEDASKELSPLRTNRHTQRHRLAQTPHIYATAATPNKIYLHSTQTSLPPPTDSLSAGSGLRQRC